MTRLTYRVHGTDRDDDWRDQGACRSVDPEIFFSSPLTRDGREDVRAAKVVCFGCPVMQDCGQWALANREPFGVWGGMSDGERRKILRRRGVHLIADPDEAEAAV